jgi:P-type Ca2+ transporter type 2C
MEKGLSTSEVLALQQKHGKNVISANATSSALKMFAAQFPTLINIILFVAGIFFLIIGDRIDSSFIFAVILVNACFGFIQEYRAEKSLEKLKQYASPTARVRRNGEEAQILAEDIVIGDIIVLSEGDRIPADGKLLDSDNLEVDESILTGESLSVVKANNDLVFWGTLITKGKGIARIEQIGMETKFGQIAHTLTSIKEEKTPLQKNFDHMARLLAIFALLAGLSIIPAGLYHSADLVPLLLVAGTIGVAAIPEGLPAVITIAFAVGTHRMAKRNAIVRKMAAIETLGAIQIVLVDKTGTITQNKMKVKDTWLLDKDKLHFFVRSCLLGNTASLAEKANNEYEIIGDQTDGAMLVWAKHHESLARTEGGKILDEYVFDSSTKTITTLWHHGEHEYAFVRGAPEFVLDKCKISDEDRAKVKKQFEEYAKAGLRTIGFAYKRETHIANKNRESLESELTFLGLMAMYDPPRLETKDAIAKAHKAGILVSMVTGDNEHTALTLAKEVGLIDKDEDVITGEELEKLTDEELSSIILKTRIFARTKPEQKLRLATILQKQGLVVGVTGDGVNDALALKKADVGVSMGRTGTDVAKEASDIILSDDNFATLIKAIEEGRVIYKNIVNAVLYLISGNLAKILLVFFATMFNLPLPLLPTQILWINLITDSIPALALATGSRDGTVLSKKPRDPKTPLLSFDRLFIIGFIALALAEFMLFYYYNLLQTTSINQARTTIFNSIIYLHLLIVIGFGWHSIRRGNLFLIGTVIFIFLLQVFVNHNPFFQEILHLTLP